MRRRSWILLAVASLAALTAYVLWPRQPLLAPRLTLAEVRAQYDVGDADVDPATFVIVRRLADLRPLADGRARKYVVRADGTLAIAPRPADEPDNKVHHPFLAFGEPVRTAGRITVHARGEGLQVTVDRNSATYCPPLESLSQVEGALHEVGLSPYTIQRDVGSVPRCVAPRN